MFSHPQSPTQNLKRMSILYKWALVCKGFINFHWKLNSFMNDGIKENIPLFWKLLRNFEDYFFTENELDQQKSILSHNSWSQEFNVRAAPTYENHQVLMRKGKFIKFWRKENALSSDSRCFLLQDLHVENAYIKSLHILTLVRKNIPPASKWCFSKEPILSNARWFIPPLVQLKPVHPTSHTKPKSSAKRPKGRTKVAHTARLCQTTSQYSTFHLNPTIHSQKHSNPTHFT